MGKPVNLSRFTPNDRLIIKKAAAYKGNDRELSLEEANKAYKTLSVDGQRLLRKMISVRRSGSVFLGVVNFKKPVAAKLVKKCGGFLDAFHLKHAMPSYLKGTVLIPKTKWGQIYRCAKLPNTSLAKSWLKTVDVAYRRNVAQKMSKERALLKAIVHAYRKWKFRYRALGLQKADPIIEGLGVLPLIKPHYLLKYKSGTCAGFATLVAATIRHYKMKYALIVTKHHAISAIVRKPDASSPKDLKATRISHARFPGSKSKGVDFYPIDVSSIDASSTLAKTYRKGKTSLKNALGMSGVLVIDQNGRSLLPRGQR